MSDILKGKVVLVTGAASAIGRAVTSRVEFFKKCPR